MLIAGIDECGRGPAIGPMVMCIVAAKESMINDLIFWGVKDSKKISPKKREQLYEILKKEVIYKYRIISAREIDACLKDNNSNLNWLEAEISAQLTNELLKKHNIKRIFLDCPSNNISAYENFFKKLIKKNIEIICEHKSDENYPIVGAASIIAKVIRDSEIEKIKIKYNVNFGSGYTSDKNTIIFLKNYYLKNREFPDFVRKSWKTISNIKREIKQRKIDTFIE
ncbi:MAG: ribonuclease HII [Candidatus Helarchaeota archaeon]